MIRVMESLIRNENKPVFFCRQNEDDAVVSGKPAGLGSRIGLG